MSLGRAQEDSGAATFSEEDIDSEVLQQAAVDALQEELPGGSLPSLGDAHMAVGCLLALGEGAANLVDWFLENCEEGDFAQTRRAMLLGMFVSSLQVCTPGFYVFSVQCCLMCTICSM